MAILKVQIDSNEKAGMTEFIQYGVEMPNGKQYWVDKVGSDFMNMPGTSGGLAVSLFGVEAPSYSHPWEAGLEAWARHFEGSGVTIDDNTVFPKRIKRNVTVIVHRDETISNL